MTIDEGKSRAAAAEERQQPYYGTFQGVSTHSEMAETRIPQPVPPLGATYHAHAYQAIPGHAIPEGIPLREHRLPCCGIGVGWFLFIIGFVLGAIPWYVGAIVLVCSRFDYREKPGYIACTVAAILATIAIILGATKESHAW